MTKRTKDEKPPIKYRARRVSLDTSIPELREFLRQLAAGQYDDELEGVPERDDKS